MASGTPVVTSNVSSLPEVAGDAAVLVDPYSAEAIAAGMYKVLTDNTCVRSSAGAVRSARATFRGHRRSGACARFTDRSCHERVGRRVAIVHDWLTGMRGGEKVLDAVCERFPDAELFTLVHVPGSVSPAIERLHPQTSFVQRLPS